MKKNTHGGARKGSGPKPGKKPPTASLTVRLLVEQRDYLKATRNASRAAREAVELHRKKTKS